MSKAKNYKKKEKNKRENKKINFEWHKWWSSHMVLWVCVPNICIPLICLCHSSLNDNLSQKRVNWNPNSIWSITNVHTMNKHNSTKNLLKNKKCKRKCGAASSCRLGVVISLIFFFFCRSLRQNLKWHRQAREKEWERESESEWETKALRKRNEKENWSKKATRKVEVSV